MGASDPVIVTRYVGKTPGAVAPLVELADLLAIPVVQHPQSPYMNFPSSHPCHAGHDIPGHVKTADVVFLVDIDVPWTPATRDILRPEATVLQLEVDPLFSSIPVWGFPVDHAMTGSSDVTLPVLNGLVRQGLDGSEALRKSVEARRSRINAAHDETRAELAARIEKVKDERPHPSLVGFPLHRRRGGREDHRDGRSRDLAPGTGAGAGAARVVLRPGARRPPGLGNGSRHRRQAGRAGPHGHRLRGGRLLHVLRAPRRATSPRRNTRCRS